MSCGEIQTSRYIYDKPDIFSVFIQCVHYFFILKTCHQSAKIYRSCSLFFPLKFFSLIQTVKILVNQKASSGRLERKLDDLKNLLL